METSVPWGGRRTGAAAAGPRAAPVAGPELSPGGVTWGLLEAIVRSSPAAIIGIGVDRRIRTWNGAARRLFGYSADEALGQLEPQLLATDPAGHELDVSRVMGGGRFDEVETSSRTKNGAIVDLRLTLTAVRDPSGEVIGVVAMGVDVTAQHRVERELSHHLEHDQLTGLFNRRRVTLEVERCLSYSRSTGIEGALLVLDIDHFNLVNDSDGRAGGDRLLLFNADVLRSYAQGSDIVGRIGGDEFVLMLPSAGSDRAMEVAQEIRGRLRAFPEGAVRASIGIASYDGDASVTADDLFAAADIALRECKRCGGDRAMLFEPSAGSAVGKVEEIRSAIAENRLMLFGQPVIELASGRLAGHELLLRMRGQNGGLIMPSEFIPVAERFGLIGEIDLWVTSQGLRLAAQGHVVGVNLSGASIGSQELLYLISSAAAAGVDVGRLIIEITETAAIDLLPEAVEFSQALSRFGAHVALDDFGTGFGSFTHLKHLESDLVKIDVEFVRDLLDSPTDQHVIRSIVEVAHALGKRAVAEGIEDGATLMAVKALGADYAQGFYVGRPAPVEAPARVLPRRTD